MKLIVDSCEFNYCSSGTNNGSGGAIQCYLPCVELKNTQFSDCWAGKEGGAVNNFYGDNYVDPDTGVHTGRDALMFDNAYMKVNGCTFTRCRAEDRYDINGSVHFGGGIASKARILEVKNSTFEDCVSTLKQGGAIHCSGIGSGSTATIEGSTFKNCQAKNSGGALCASNETMSVSGSYFYGCSSFASNGGAVYHGDSVNKMTQTTTTISDCTFSADPNPAEGETAEGCSAAYYGGAVWSKATTVGISDSAIDGSTAFTGGGVFIASGSTATISDCTISNNTADWGSAVFMEKSAKATFTGTENKGTSITGNVSTNASGCAVEVGESGGRMYFEGKVIVKDNTSTQDGECDHDVRMHFDTYAIVNTTTNGLLSSEEIGVYVGDENNAYAKRGTENQTFGTWASGDGGNYLDAFFNDRHTELTGYQVDGYKVNWGYYVCKITDADGNTLQKTNGRDAVYQRLTAALHDFVNVQSANTATPVYIKMLTEDYEIQQTGQVENIPATSITLTTETHTDDTAVEGEYDGKHPYRGTEGSVCTISRANSTNNLFYLNKAATTFVLENITLDGRKDKTATQGNYRLIQADKGAVLIGKGATLQYGCSSHGGAIYAGSNAV